MTHYLNDKKKSIADSHNALYWAQATYLEKAAVYGVSLSTNEKHFYEHHRIRNTDRIHDKNQLQI